MSAGSGDQFGGKAMLYMVIERFKPGAASEIYRRLRNEGRRLVEGLEYVASWVDLDFATCWQIMRTDDRALLENWCAAGRELVDFEIVPVRISAEAAAVMAARDT
jgi:hypothetical protein